MIRNFRDIIVWQKAHALTLEIYKITKYFPKDEMYALTSQMRRASISVAANIVEGFTRKGRKDSIHFYNISDASLAELRYYNLLCYDLRYINEDQYELLETIILEVGKVLNGWSRSQQR